MAMVGGTLSRRGSESSASDLCQRAEGCAQSCRQPSQGARDSEVQARTREHLSQCHLSGFPAAPTRVPTAGLHLAYVEHLLGQRTHLMVTTFFYMWNPSLLLLSSTTSVTLNVLVPHS